MLGNVVLFESDSLCYFCNSIPRRKLDTLLAQTASHILCETTKRSIKMASSKSLITVFFVVVLITFIEPVESRECTVIKTGLPCTKHCCGKGPYIFTCKDDCKGTACDSDDDCGDGCCKDDKCEDCPGPTGRSY